MENNKLTKAERLRGKTTIDKLFATGSSFIVYPYRIVYTSKTEDKSQTETNTSLLVSVPKKKFKRAVKRNYIRRRIKEAFRLNKSIIKDTPVNIAILYLSTDVPEYILFDQKMKETLRKLTERLSKEDNDKTQ